MGNIQHLIPLEYTSVHVVRISLSSNCNLFGFPVETSIAAGDAENDISMLSMQAWDYYENALPSVKEIADTITVRTCAR